MRVINTTFMNKIKWPKGVNMQNMMLDLKDWCGLPSMQGAIDGMRIFIPKPNSPFAKDYYFHRIGWYVGFLGSMNDFKILHKSGVYLQVH